MATFSLKTVQCIPVDLDIAWEFFSSPANLKTITPDNLGFQFYPNIMAAAYIRGRLLNTR